MKRRLVLITLGAVLATIGSGAQAAHAGDHWGCVGVEAVDRGICVRNPLPEQLPIASTALS